MDRPHVRRDFPKKLSAETIRPWLGGTGYAARLLFDGVPPGADPLGPENLFILATGPLTDNAVPGGGSLSVCCKSPLTGGWGEARVGCDFGPELKRAGYDFVVLSGASDRPVHIVITDDRVELRDGAFLTGRKVLEREKLVKEREALEGHSVLTIGPAGEKGVLFASVMVGHRAAGRIGAGAVLGSKNVAAVSVKGTGRITPADPAAWMREVRAAHGIVKESPNTPGFTELGTMGGYENSDRIGDLPTKNWQSNSWGRVRRSPPISSGKTSGLHGLLQGMPHEVRAEGPRGERSLEDSRTRRGRVRDRGILHRLCSQRGRGLCRALRVPLQRARHRYNFHGSGHRLPVRVRGEGTGLP